MALQHLRSSTANKRPVPGNMSEGQLGINTNDGSPGLFFKDSNNALVKVGPVHVGTTAPNASPASGGTAGNSVGEQWLDTSGGTYVFKVWDGSAWRSESGTFVDVNGDVMTGALGIIAGSAGSPGLYFSGDTNTGLYSPSSDQLALATGGTERITLTSAGLVGVGTSSPAQTLDVNGTVNFKPATGYNALFQQSGTALRINYLNDAGSANVSAAYRATSFEWQRGDGSPVVNIDSSGRLGIGTSTPGVPLDVAGSIRSSTGILFGTDTAAANELDDYEEGTFTPTIVGTTSAGTGTYTNQIGRYTKIGDRVTFTIYLNWTAHTGTGNIRVSNLPFTSTSATGSFHAVSIYADGIPFTGPWLQAYVGVNSTNIGMGQMTAAGVVSGIPMDSAGDITITGHYEV